MFTLFGHVHSAVFQCRGGSIYICQNFWQIKLLLWCNYVKLLRKAVTQARCSEMSVISGVPGELQPFVDQVSRVNVPYRYNRKYIIVK